jgi:predicted ATPase
LSPLAEAFACVKRSGERWWEPELYRLQGTFLLQLPQPDEARAEECFQRAIAVARGQ